MLKWRSEIRPNLRLQGAYCLLSVAADLRVTQVVNGPAHHGAHIVLEKPLLPPVTLIKNFGLLAFFLTTPSSQAS